MIEQKRRALGRRSNPREFLHHPAFQGIHGEGEGYGIFHTRKPLPDLALHRQDIPWIRRPHFIMTFVALKATRERGASGSKRTCRSPKLRPNAKLAAVTLLRRPFGEGEGLGFELPSEIIVIGRNGRKLESASVLEVL